MRHLLPILFVTSTMSVLGGQRPPPLDIPVAGQFRAADPTLRDPCTLWTTIEQMARQGRVRVGFENTAGCWLGSADLSPGEGALNLDGLTPREAFDRLVHLRPDFRWNEMDGVVVIRPAAAWDDPAGILSRPVARFAVESAHVHNALHVVLQSAHPTLFWPHIDVQLSSTGNPGDPPAAALIDAPISVKFSGGTLLQALNAVTKSYGGIWQVGYSDHRLHVQLSTLEFSDGSTGIVSAPFAPEGP